MSLSVALMLNVSMHFHVSNWPQADECFTSFRAQLVHSTMETFDLDKDGFLNFDEFCDLMHNAGLELTL